MLILNGVYMGNIKSLILYGIKYEFKTGAMREANPSPHNISSETTAMMRGKIKIFRYIETSVTTKQRETIASDS